MNLYLLVEGRRTERKVYREWISRVLPSLQEVDRIQDIVADHLLILTGGGYPSCLNRIRATLEDIRNHDRPIDHYLLCIDAEEDPYDQRLAALENAVEAAAAEVRVRERQPQINIHIIVQNCCIETWFLGHTRMLKRNPTSSTLATWKRRFDVSVEDPEAMPAAEGYITRASFHLAYLKEMLSEHGKRYSKEHPGVVTDLDYFKALRDRCRTTMHLHSLEMLLRVLDDCGAAWP
jgi:hypothetical protein